MKEVWIPFTKPVDFTGVYEISNYGRIKRLGRYAKIKGHWIPDKIIIGYVNSKGYVKVSIIGMRHLAMHRLVGIHFIPNPENLPEINHIDFDKTNNKASNLEWVTPKGNMAHYYSSERAASINNAKVKFSKKDVAYIRANLLVKGAKALALEYNTHKNYIYAIGTGRKRAKDAGALFYTSLGRSKVILDINSGVFYESATELAELLGTKRKYICRMISGERRPNKSPYRYI